MRSTQVGLVMLCAVLSFAGLCPSAPASRPARLGMAGIWPPAAILSGGQVQATPESWASYWTMVKSHADQVAIHAPWQSVAAVMDVAKANGLAMTVVTPIAGVTDADLPAYLDVAKRAIDYDVRWWCVGNEVDADAELAAESLRASTITKAIKAANPAVQTCVVFQFERLAKMSDAATRVALFSAVDGVFFTTYPSVAGSATTAAGMPSNYYAPIRAWTSKPIGFTEVGWPIDVGGATEQNAFLARFLQSLAPRDAVLVNWFSAFDMSGANLAPPTFGHMGLCASATTCRPALTTWDQARAVPYLGK